MGEADKSEGYGEVGDTAVLVETINSGKITQEDLLKRIAKQRSEISSLK
ncbi:hypothetical protein HOF56_00940 [Candidatus Peribacteria bacterium]|mgnify:CR=1|jgi:hypothetical protein|nr:hypothetical protein [Candidatus Peribacteria bacterium]MBT4020839.1 hypothetical protein [Candidatus Peribacteria bacterium]MBT4241128.1 hypothetical protein [Candidatus Peribacteria bacterium]MBT4473850.1 hypothetical protein [Candidatus Peribacteria bacterium]